MATKKIANPSGPDFFTMTVDGEDTRPRDAVFVVYNPAGEPVDSFPSDISIKDSIASAARSYWKNVSLALVSLNEGHRIELMGKRRFLREVAAKLADNLG